jgi:hypothetical protein
MVTKGKTISKFRKNYINRQGSTPLIDTPVIETKNKNQGDELKSVSLR